MGNYRQHITFASVLGGMYSAAAWVGLNVHWFYGTVATLFTRDISRGEVAAFLYRIDGTR